jgi:hypothetical protein
MIVEVVTHSCAHLLQHEVMSQDCAEADVHESALMPQAGSSNLPLPNDMNV